MSQLKLIETLKKDIADIKLKEYQEDLHQIQLALAAVKTKLNAGVEHNLRSSFHRKSNMTSAWRIFINEVSHLIAKINEEEHRLSHEANDKLGYTPIISQQIAAFSKKAEVRVLLHDMIIQVSKSLPEPIHQLHDHIFKI